MKLFVPVVALSIFAAPFVVHAEFDACDRVFKACAAQGYSKDDTAAVGKKIWLNCADVIVNQQKNVPKVDLDPKGPDAKYCRDYREARAKFDTEWEKNNKRPVVK